MKRLFCLLLLLSCSLFAQESTGKIYYPTPAPAPIAAPAAATSSATTSILYLAFLAFLAAATYYLWKKKLTPQRTLQTTAPALDIISTRPLGNRQFLVIVRYKDKELLLGVGPGFINKIEGDTLGQKDEDVCD